MWQQQRLSTVQILMVLVISSLTCLYVWQQSYLSPISFYYLDNYLQDPPPLQGRRGLASNPNHESGNIPRLLDHPIACYRYDTLKQDTLADILKEHVIPPGSIFFHETSCNSYLNHGLITLNARQACAVESAAKHHPNHKVYVLFASSGILAYNHKNDPILDALQWYSNVHLRHLNFTTYTTNTAVERLYGNGLLEKSSFPVSHASDVLRYVTLWRFGGTYMDLDVVVLKSIDGLNENFAGAESMKDVAVGVLNLGNTPHSQNARQCLEHLNATFNGQDWGNNGPGVITRWLRQVCHTNYIKEIINSDRCKEVRFNVRPPSDFYPIPYENWTLYMEKGSMKHPNLVHVKKAIQKSIVAHVWNRFSQKIPLQKSNGAIPYVYLARKHCPRVFKSVENIF